MAAFKSYKTELLTAAKIEGEYLKPGTKIRISSKDLEKTLESAGSIRGKGEEKEIPKIEFNDDPEKPDRSNAQEKES